MKLHLHLDQLKKTWTLNSLLIHSFLLFSTVGISDSFSVPQGSLYVYEVNIDKGITFRGEIIISNSAKPVTVEIYDPSGEIIDKITVLDKIEISFITEKTGEYEVKFHNFELESSVDVIFNYSVKRDIPFIPGYSICTLLIGAVLSVIVIKIQKRNAYVTHLRIKSCKLA